MKEKGKKLFMSAMMIICMLMAGSQAWGDVAIDETNFPDANFRSHVSSNFDSDSDGVLSNSEISAVTSIDVSIKHITSIKGIEYFTYLISLDCTYNQLTALDVSKNTALTILNCKGDLLNELDVSKNTALTFLDCSSNYLTELDLSKNIALTYLSCSDTYQMTKLDVSKNTALTYLDCSGNKITELDLSKNTALTHIFCGGQPLMELNIGNNTALTELSCSGNSLMILDVSNCTALKVLSCANSYQLTELNVSNCTALTRLSCSNYMFPNELTRLDVSSCTALTYLNCDRNRLTKLDVSKNTALTELRCMNNQLTELDLSKNTKLEDVLCGNQENPTLKCSKRSDGMYEVDLKNYVTDISRLKIPESYSNNYDSKTGIMKLLPVTSGSSYKEPSVLSYKYDTKAPNIKYYDHGYMSVRLEKQGSIITTRSLPKATQGEAYSYTLEVSGEEPVTWILVDSRLPKGLSLSSSGTISGTPTESGIFVISVIVSNSDNFAYSDRRIFTLKVNTPEVKITTGETLPKGTSGSNYTKTLKATGADSFTWSISSGTLPNGLSLDLNTGKITGKPTKAAKFTFTVKAEANGASAEKSFTLTIAKTLSISGTLNTGIKYAAYTGTLKVTGGVSPYTWRISSGALPDGFTINESTGKISGTPVKAGTFTFKVNVKDKNGASKTKSYTVKITKPSISGTLSSGIKYASYSKTLKASNGTSPYKWSISEGTLPDGLTINESTGKISGTPTKAGTFKFTVKVTDKNDSAAAKEYAVKITKPEITGTLSNGIKSASYTGTLKASGGTSPYTWTISEGALPDGLTIGESTGKISGTPTKAGTFNFTVKIKDKNKAAAVKSYTVKITKPSISGTLSAGAVGKSYSKTLKATGGTASYKWTKASGTLPSGLKLGKTTGKISGTPTEAGKFTFKIKVTDANGVTATKSYTVTIKAADASSSENAYVNVYESLSEESKAEDENLITEEEKENETSSLNNDSAVQSMNADPETHVNFAAELQVMSNDVISQGTGRYEDLVNVRVNQPVRFIITAWPREVSDERVYLDDELIEDIKISEGMFTLSAEFVHDDFKVYVKARAVDSELESEELYISATD